MSARHACTERVSVRFLSAEKALIAARGFYPLDYLVAVGGNTRVASSYATHENNIREDAHRWNIGSRPHDAVFVWLPADVACAYAHSSSQ